MRPRVSVVRELRRVAAILLNGPAPLTYDGAFAQGAQQALCWALRENAAAPSKCLTKPKRSRTRRPKRKATP